MNGIIDQVYEALVYASAEIWVSGKTPIIGFCIAFTVSILKTADEGDARWFESLLCGVFAGVILTAAKLLGFDPNISIGLVSASVGYFGTKRTAGFLMERFTGRKADDSN